MTLANPTKVGKYVHGNRTVEKQHLTIISIEIHVKTRLHLRPDPNFDPIQAIFYCIQDENFPQWVHGVLMTDYYRTKFKDAPNNMKVDYFPDEPALVRGFIELAQKYDPEIIVGYDVQTVSFGYIAERAQIICKLMQFVYFCYR